MGFILRVCLSIGPVQTGSYKVRKTSEGPRMRAWMTIGPVQEGSYGRGEISDVAPLKVT